MREGSRTASGAASPPSQSRSGRDVRPTNEFVEFRKEELERSVADRFEQQVLRSPHRLAIRSRRHEFSYAALNEAANQIAHAILGQRDEGDRNAVTPGAIALLFDHGALVIAAIMGVLKAGKIYVPLDPTHPRARTEYVLADSGARLIVTDGENLPLAEELAQNGFSLIHAEEIDPHTSTANPGMRVSPDTLANILYTSGSTGQPKGVVQDHRHLLEETRLHTNDLHICAEDRLCLHHACSSSASLRRIFPALLNGAPLFPIDIKKEGVRALPDWLIQEGITIAPGQHLLRKCEDALTGPEQFPRTRLITFGGDTVYRSDVEKYRRYLPDDCLMVVNLASTEAGTIARFFLDKQTEITSGVVPVGCPVDGKKVLLLDEAGAEVAAGEVGEIVVQSRVLFRGYWRRPDLTEAVLRPAPDGGDELVFKTGDLGRILPDGCLMHVGRRDFQVKVRGYRVEIGEVEMALREVSAIQDTVVVARQDRGGDSRLVAYLAPGAQTVPTASALRRALAVRLPEYMIPSAFVVLEELPRTATGKVDRKALPAPGRARPALDSLYAPPRTPIERALVEVWADFLELDTVGIHDPFLELGGNSLLATRVIARLRETLAVELPLRCFFEHPTVAEVAVVITQDLAHRTLPEEILDLVEELEQLTEAELQSRLTVESA